MRRLRLFKFIKASGALGATSVGFCIVSFVISIVEHVRDKNVPAYVFALLAPVFFAFGAYLAWSAENEKWEAEKALNKRPSLKIEVRGAFFDVSKVPGTQNAQVHIHAYLRVANLRETPTLIKRGVLTLLVGGVEYTGQGDDISKTGSWLEHNSDFRLGGDKKGEVFSNTFSPVRRLMADVNWEYPLVHGVHRDGIVVFTFGGSMDWDHENPSVMTASSVRLSLIDTFDHRHSVTLDKLDIPAGALTGTAN